MASSTQLKNLIPLMGIIIHTGATHWYNYERLRTEANAHANLNIISATEWKFFRLGLS